MPEQYVLVAAFDWAELAEEWLARLQAEGIPARLTRTPATDEAPEEIRLEVAAEHAEHVDRLMADASGAVLPPEPSGPSWPCPSCGWPVSVERITCPRCRAMRPAGAEPAPPPPAPTDVIPSTSDLAPQPARLRTRPHRLSDLDRGDYSFMDATASTWLLIGMASLAWVAGKVHWPAIAVPVLLLMGVSVWRVRELALERADAARRSGCLGWGLLLLHLVSLFIGLMTLVGLFGGG
jgi:hypothetical protein